MKITCPSCAADYNVPDTLAAGRTVRCAKCATEWTPVPTPEPVVEPLPPPEPEVQLAAPVAEIPARLAPPAPPPPGRRLPLLLAWVGSIAVIGAALVAAVLFRGPIMHAWPPSQRIYGTLGMQAEASPDVHGDVMK